MTVYYTRLAQEQEDANQQTIEIFQWIVDFINKRQNICELLHIPVFIIKWTTR